MFQQANLTETYKKSFVGKLPAWAWRLILYFTFIFAGFFSNQSTFNLMPLQLTTSIKGAETFNMLFAHFIVAGVSLLIFELIGYIYWTIAMSTTKGVVKVPRYEFIGMFRAFYCAFNIVFGLLQGLYYVNTTTYVFGRFFFAIIPRFFMILGLFFYVAKKYANEYQYSKLLIGIFVPYLAYELFILLWGILAG